MFALDLLVPCLHQRTFSDNMVHRKVQNVPCHCVATLRYAADSIFAACIMAARCQAKVVCETVRILETLYIADPRKQSDRSHCTDARYGFETIHFCHLGLGTLRTLDEFCFSFEDLLVQQFPRLDVHIDFEPINDRKSNISDPLFELSRGTIFRRCVLRHVVFVDDAFDLVDDSCALLHQVLP